MSIIMRRWYTVILDPKLRIMKYLSRYMYVYRAAVVQFL